MSLLSLVAGLAAAAFGQSISYVQAASATPQSATATVSVAYKSAETAGDMNIVVVGWNDTTATVKSVTDSAGNAYRLAIGPTSGTALRQSIYYAPNIVAGSNTVTVTFSQAAVYADIRILEYRGVTTLDVTAGASGSGTTASSGAATTTSAGELIFGADTIFTKTTAAGSGFTSRIVTEPDSDLAEDMMVSAAGSYSATASLRSGYWVMQMATFSDPPPSSGVLSGLSCTTSAFTGAGSDACTVSLTAAAGTGLAVSLSSNNSAVTVPSSVTVPAGSTSASFTATVSAETTAQNATLTASADGVSKTFVISLGAAVPGLQLSATSLSFGSVTVNTTSTQSVTLSSSGAAALTISAASVTGAGFSISGATFPLTLNAGQAATLTVSFKPTATGSATGSILLTDNASPSTATISLSGTGQALPAPTVTGVSPSSGSTAGGTAVTITGTNFASGATVTFGSTAATNVTVVNSTTITATTPAGSAGAVAVTVTSNSESGSLAGGFTYNGAPTVSSVSPNSGSTAGGTAVTITGTNFASGATVTFGSTAATSVTVVNGTTITATTPAGSAGAVAVTVTSNSESGSLAGAFTYTARPTVTSVSPNSGSTAGGTAVTITGTNFASGATVTFGTTAATNVAVVNGTTITATTPAGSAGAAAVTVTSNGQSGSLAGGFTYNGAPTVSSVSPNSGTTAGGTAVTITGTNFASGATVTFGSTAATNVAVVNGTTITATTPAGSAGAVTVTVTSNGQSGSLPGGFTYTAPAAISFVQVASATPQSATATVTIAYKSAETAGDMNMIVVGWNDASSTVNSVTDSAGNTYKPAIGPTSGTALRQSIYYAPNIVAGSDTVTVTFNQAATAPDIRILEYRGVTTLDVAAGASGSGTTASSGAATTTSASELIFGANTVETGNVAAGSGFTSRIITSPDSDQAEDEVASTAGSYSATAPLTSSGAWVMQMATFSNGGVQAPPPGVLSGLSCATGTFTGAGSDACTVSLTAAAGAGGLAIGLSSSNSSVIVPASVTVPAGSASANFAASVSAVSTTQTATLTATSGGTAKTFAISLNAVTAALTLGTTSVPFGDVNLNTPATQPVTLSSSGTAALTISGSGVTGTGFSISGISFPATLNPGQSATLDVKFDPTVAGAATGAVTLTSNASPSTSTISLSGTGVATSYQVNLTWNAPASSPDPVAGYNVYRAVSGSSAYQLVNASVDASTSYSDSTVQNGTSYSYYVESVDAQGNQSAPSNTFTVSIP